MLRSLTGLSDFLERRLYISYITGNLRSYAMITTKVTNVFIFTIYLRSIRVA